MLFQLTSAVGEVTVQNTRHDYLEYQPKDPDLDYEGTHQDVWPTWYPVLIVCLIYDSAWYYGIGITAAKQRL